mgnify:CR=1 FL=1
MHRLNLRGSLKSRSFLMLGGVLSFLLLAGGAAVASPVISWSTSNNQGGHLYSANAQVLNNNNNTWSIVLTNTGGVSSLNMHTLTGFFWVDSSTGAYTKVGAVANAGSGVFNDNGSAAAGLVSDHWGYKNNLGLGSFNQGIGAAGFGLFGGSNAFTGNSSLQGDDWGLVNGFAPGGIAGNQNPWVSNSAVFTFGGQVTANQFGLARFQYGSELTQPSFEVLPPTGTPVTPEIGSVYQMMAAGLPLIGLGVARRRRRTS